MSATRVLAVLAVVCAACQSSAQRASTPLPAINSQASTDLQRKLPNIKQELKEIQEEILLAPEEETVRSAWQDGLALKIEGVLREKALTAADALTLARDADALRMPDLQIRAVEKGLMLKPSGEAYELKGKALEQKYYDAIANEAAAKQLAAEAARSFKSAMQASALPNPSYLIEYASMLDASGVPAPEARAAYLRALHEGIRSDLVIVQQSALRGLIAISESENRETEADSYFRELTKVGAGSGDWGGRAFHKQRAGLYVEAAEAFQSQADKFDSWQPWCRAAWNWNAAVLSNAHNSNTGRDFNDLALADGRKCSDGAELKGFNPKPSDRSSDESSFAAITGNVDRQALAQGDRVIAEALVRRGVYEEALARASKAVDLNPSDPSNLSVQADAQIGLRHFEDAVVTLKQAIVKTDGKFSFLHFQLGNAYFELKQWELADQSYEKAAELDPKDPVAPYNVAMSLLNSNHDRSAVHWLREVVRRDAKYAADNDVPQRVQNLEKQLDK